MKRVQLEGLVADEMVASDFLALMAVAAQMPAPKEGVRHGLGLMNMQ
jgi:hypothetical protein